ncbi:MAG TPA: hypothetical protein PLG43_08430 [Spirochaetia bacterium]|jgi:mannose-6-phosphate isomerase-like protein (cupin superfamily)|nr:hypothetical protein [Spirochaetia bacterium]
MKQKLGNVFFEKIDYSATRSEPQNLLQGEINGANVLSYKPVAGSTILFPPQGDYVRIFVLINGEVEFLTNGSTFLFKERTFFVPDPAKGLSVRAAGNPHFLELRWNISKKDEPIMKSFESRAPLIQPYAEAPLYNDDTKSKKTLSRSIILQYTLPRICIGSVETNGPDHVDSHVHPHVDQLFYTFPENDMDLIVENERHHIGGNTLLHIPLGSSHGAEVASGRKLHYIWIDFIIDTEGFRYLDESHRLVDAK